MRRLWMMTVAVLAALTMMAQGNGDLGTAQWIGHMTRQQANLPQGRNFTGAKLKEPAVKAAWAAVHPLADHSIWLRRDFQLKGTVSKATAYICGLGFYELTINGQKVGDSEFTPSWSDYDKTVFYNEYDVTGLLNDTDGKTVRHKEIRVLLGNGFYNELG
ncbi:MAG: alpha-L-rhamnosidase N-terminal domain-containing protein, partial [Prevotella sp.]|nr:alpha-L-rhamnosidase N-terminal domain-containing protein [Prevotella sp.]